MAAQYTLPFYLVPQAQVLTFRAEQAAIKSRSDRDQEVAFKRELGHGPAVGTAIQLIPGLCVRSTSLQPVIAIRQCVSSQWRVSRSLYLVPMHFRAFPLRRIGG